MLVVRCDEHDHRLMGAGDLPQDLEPVLARHVDVEQDEIGPRLGDGLYGS